jgi:indole-3-glycerol phosphate synthase
MPGDSLSPAQTRNAGKAPGNKTVLDEILASKRREIEELRHRSSPAALRERALAAAPPLDFFGRLRSCDRVPIIAEVKRVSPSAGRLRADLDVVAQAMAYRAGGAAAISVITDGPYFGGSLNDLIEVRKGIDLPILRKDFVLDPIQVYESRIAGADAVLLIAAALDPAGLQGLRGEVQALGMLPLIEVHDEMELERVLPLSPPVVGINNRDLRTLRVSLETSKRLRPRIPSDILVIGESGIERPQDIQYLRSCGVDAFLVGTALMRSPDPTSLLADLCARTQA